MSLIHLSNLANFAIIFILTSSLFISNHSVAQPTPQSIHSDTDALIKFRSQLTLGGHPNPLSSWDRSSSPCNWTRVECNKHGHRVIGLDLSSLQLGGSVSPYIGNLSFLKSLQLQNNHLKGTIPNVVCNLLGLEVLNLSTNFFQGEIPSNITNLRQLKVLDLIMNNLTGKIPSQIGLFKKLRVLNLAKNLFSGPIPASIGKISSLITLDLSTNCLSGSVPSELTHLVRLKHFDLSTNNLKGLLPPQVYKMSSLVVLALALNELRGEIPHDVGKTLPNLRVIFYCINQFRGSIPGSLHSIKNIQDIRLAHNLFTGTVPPGLGNLPKLTMYNIGYNRIVSSGDNGLDFINLLANSPQLKYLAFDGNLIEGFIPESIGNLSKVLSKLYMGSNRIRGRIPSTISQLTGLNLLNMSNNQITGAIPGEIIHIQDLQVLDLANNHISGYIPEKMGALRKLEYLDLSNNNLVGEVPSSFGEFSALNSIDLSSNMLNGRIPKEIFNASISISLRLSNNHFSGELPQDIGFLNTVIAIDLCNNRLSGNIPSSISNCKSLETLNMSRNSFSGSIPSSLGQMNALETLDLSNNQLTGFIPSELQFLNGTQSLNLSFNDLNGGLPCGGVFRNLSIVHLQGNPKISFIWECSRIEYNAHHSFKKIIIIIIAVVTFLVLCAVVSAFLFAISKRKSTIVGPSDSSVGKLQLVKYDELRQATGNFSERNLIGRGGFGSVFRGVLKDNMVVAIKVLDLQMGASWKSFVRECEALRNVRHRNLVKLITSCSSLDYKNMEFVALVYEYTSNGSLEDWIKGRKKKENGDGLGFLERLSVIIDVASALEYLHCDSEVPVVHCDLKPSNILLDEDMTAKVGDFGLAALLMDKTSGKSSISSSHVLKGSIGYMPPEYGLGVRPSIAGDTYSFGVTLLELFTGKSPTHESLTGNENLIAWVRTSFPDHVLEVTLDPKIRQEFQSNDYTDSEQKEAMDQLLLIFEVGLNCTLEHPDGRSSLRDVLRKLKAVGENFSKSSGLKK